MRLRLLKTRIIYGFWGTSFSSLLKSLQQSIIPCKYFSVSAYFSALSSLLSCFGPFFSLINFALYLIISTMPLSFSSGRIIFILTQSFPSTVITYFSLCSIILTPALPLSMAIEIFFISCFIIPDWSNNVTCLVPVAASQSITSAILSS